MNDDRRSASVSVRSWLKGRRSGATLATLLALSLAGCGQKGPLTLPSNAATGAGTPKPKPTATTTAPSAPTPQPAGRAASAP